MSTRTPFACADSYKLSHWIQYPDNIRYVYSNLTPRRSLRPGIDHFVLFGLQAFLIKLENKFKNDFFSLSAYQAVNDFAAFYERFFGEAPSQLVQDKVRDLHNYGHLPLRIAALPEGSVVRHGVPVLTIENTEPDVPWLTNFIESWLSSEVWHPCTTATTSMYYRIDFDRAANTTSDALFMTDFQGHDFSFRGMSGIEAAASSGAAHLLNFKGTDCLPALGWIDEYYPGTDPSELLGTSVPATEHSVMCAGGEATEIETFRRLLRIYPKGILSVVSDTWDFWKVVTQILPELKDEIMARDGKLVIRPDSGDPVKIICGDDKAEPGSPEHRGLIRCLYESFGGTVNSKGFIDLDPHIGAIYGDSITLQRQSEILAGLKDDGFASTNVVLGIGSYTYQYVTRDTHGLAIKATAVGTDEQDVVPIFKDPKTDTSGKKSARGMLAVDLVDGEYVLAENVDRERAANCAFETVFDGKLVRRQSFSDVRNVVAAQRERLL